MHLTRATLAGVALALALSHVAASALADPTKQQCIDADAKAQDLRRDHKLSLAREQLMVCAAASCPGVVRTDCAKQLAIVEEAQPTFVFDVVDAEGARVQPVKITVDGVPLPNVEGGTGAVLDPGPHTVRFEARGHVEVTRTLVVAEGDRGHHEHVVMQPAETDAREPVAPPPPVAAEGGLGTQRQLAIAAAGAGVVGLVVGSIFGAMTLSEKSQQESDCATTCSAAGHAAALSDHSSGITDSTVSTVGIVAGALLVGGGAVLFFTAHPSAKHETAPAVTLLPSVGPGAGQMLVTGRF